MERVFRLRERAEPFDQTWEMGRTKVKKVKNERPDPRSWLLIHMKIAFLHQMEPGTSIFQYNRGKERERAEVGKNDPVRDTAESRPNPEWRDLTRCVTNKYFPIQCSRCKAHKVEIEVKNDPARTGKYWPNPWLDLSSSLQPALDLCMKIQLTRSLPSWLCLTLVFWISPSQVHVFEWYMVRPSVCRRHGIVKALWTWTLFSV